LQPVPEGFANAQLFFTLFLGSGIQDLSCTSAAQDKSCTPEPKMRVKNNWAFGCKFNTPGQTPIIFFGSGVIRLLNV
jgi:hypothetical protein